MKSSYSKPLFVCFSVLILFTTIISGYSVYNYWENGIMASENLSTVDSVSSKLDALEKENYLKQLHSHVLSDEVSKSIEELSMINDIMTEAENDLGVSESSEWSNSSKKLKKSLSDIQSISSVKTLLSVMNSKVSSFNKYVIENNWRTLTRVSNQVKVRLSPFVSDFEKNSYAKTISNFQKRLEKDINYMEVITKNSVLSNIDKNNIVIRLDSLRKEVKLLKEYIQYRINYFNQYKETKSQYTKWLESMKPAIIDKKIELMNSTKNILYVLVTVFISCLVSLVGGYFFYLYSSKRSQGLNEKKVDTLIKEGVIPLNGKVDDNWSHSFRESVQVYREYIHKRMSFGSIFQDAMPFSSILLDSNLNLVWANSLFFEHWNIDKERQQSNDYTWDTLQRFTNLGEDDPVVTAIKENIAGIYQIQVKTENSENSAPFEMYVSPVEYAGQKRIMVIFYPLRSIEETMRNQLKSVVGPVSKSIDAISQESFDGELKDKAKEDFSVAGLDNIYEKFENLESIFMTRKLNFLDEIEDLENRNYELTTIVNNYESNNENRKVIEDVVLSSFTTTKDKIIAALDSRQDVETLFDELANTTREIVNKEAHILNTSEDIITVLFENQKTVKSIVQIKEDFKELKSRSDSHRSKINSLVDYCKRGKVNDDVLTKIQSEIMALEDVLGKLGKVATSLDVSLSKAQIIMDGNHIPSIKEENEEFKRLKGEYHNILLNKESLNQHVHDKEEGLIKSLRNLYNSFQSLRKSETDDAHVKDNSAETRTL